MNISDIIDYISGRDLSKAADVEKWVAESEENRSNYFRLKEMLSVRMASDCATPEALDDAVRKVRNRIQVSRARARYRRQATFAWCVSACLALFIAVGAVVRILPTKGEIVLANNDEPVSLYSLPDGTKAFLEQGSTISYSQSFNKKSRKVKLDGMAYFDVARNEQKPFVVGTNHINVKVLGTSFNVKTDESETEIVLEKGKVALCDGSGNSLAELVPGNRALLGHGDGIRLSSVQTSLYTKWRYSYKIYDSCSFDDFVSMIENRYDVRFIYDPSKFQNVYFRLAISETDTVDDMLAMMAYIARIQYEKNGRNIYVTVK